MTSFWKNSITKLFCILGAGLCVGGCAGPARKTAVAPTENMSNGSLRHISIIATSPLATSPLTFFDKDTGKLWAYDDPGNPAQLIGELHSFDKPLTAPSVTVKTESGIILTLPSVTVKTVSGFDKTWAGRLNAMPKNLWPSADETSFEQDARDKWLADKSIVGRIGTFTGEIVDVLTPDLYTSGTFTPFADSAPKVDFAIVIEGKDATILGQHWLYVIVASIDSPGPTGALAWKKGQTLTISGAVTSMTLAPNFAGRGNSSITVNLQHAKIKPQSGAPATSAGDGGGSQR